MSEDQRDEVEQLRAALQAVVDWWEPDNAPSRHMGDWFAKVLPASRAALIAEPQDEATYGERDIAEALNEALAEAEREPRTDVAASFWDRLTDGERHIAYVDAVEGGLGGYQAACWDCDWRGTLHERKDDARPEVNAHFRDPHEPEKPSH